LKKNKKAEDVLRVSGYGSSLIKEVINDLIEAGMIEEDPLSRPELFAQMARDWVGKDVTNVFKYASGWSTDSWSLVLDTPLTHDINAQQDVFRALVILAKEAGEEL